MPINKYEYYASLEKRYGLPDGYLARTEMIESNGDIKAYNKNSKAAGPFQFTPKSQKAFGVSDPYNVEQSAEGAAKMAAQNKAILQQKGIENPTAADLYAAHQQGAKGYTDLLKAGDKPAAAVVGKEAVTWNGGDPNMSASQFASKVASKYSSLDKPQETQPATDIPQEPAPSTLSTQDALDSMNYGPREEKSDMGSKELGFLHNYFKSLDTSATGVKPLTVPDFFNQPRYASGGIAGIR